MTPVYDADVYFQGEKQQQLQADTSTLEGTMTGVNNSFLREEAAKKEAQGQPLKIGDRVNLTEKGETYCVITAVRPSPEVRDLLPNHPLTRILTD